MKKFWGQGDSSSLAKFSRDDDQILALNYENLCDGDYLQRLFINDPFEIKETWSTSMVYESSRSPISPSDSSLLNPELAEDIIIFGNNIELGKMLFDKRIVREMEQSGKIYDSIYLQISRQVLIYDHMASLMVKRCLEVGPVNKEESSSTLSTQANCPTLSFACVASSLRMIRSIGDLKLLNATHIKTIVHGFVQFFEVNGAMNRHSGSSIFSEARLLFFHCVKRLFSPDCFNTNVWHRSAFEEDISFILSGIFGLLSIGMLTNNADDIIAGTVFLSLLVMMVEERSESIIQRLREDSLSTSLANSKALPSKLSAKIKQQQIANKGPLQKVPLGSRQQGDLEDKNASAAPARFEPRDIEVNSSTCSDNTPSRLQSHGSGSRLWDKTTSANRMTSFEKEKEALKIKPSKAIKPTDPSKLLNEYLDGKDMVGASNLFNAAPIVHYALTDNAPKSNQGNNHDNRVLRDRSVIQENTTINYEAKRVERELKDSVQTIFQLPKTILSVLQSYRSVLSASSSSPALDRKLSLLKPKESNLSSPFGSKLCSKVYSCGQNSYGELGLGDVNMRKSFTRVNALDDKGIVSIGAGNEHSLFVTRDGKLVAAGYNDNGQCGIGSTQQVRLPTVVQGLEDEEIQHVHVYNGCEHTLAVTKEGKIYSFGYNYRGQLGLGSTNSEIAPRPVRALLSRKVVLAACSYHHSVILCSDGTVFSCGRNDSGQLGHGDTVDKKTPQAILSAPKNITSISCGQYHTIASTTQGIVFACGKNDYGQLGMDGVLNQKIFSKIALPLEMDNISQVCCGYYHTLILSTSGMVGGFGRNDYGQLGLGHALPKVYQCAVVGGLRDKLVVTISAGCYHSVAVTTNGMLYVFGRNNHGQLATGDLEERHSPHPVDDFIGQHIVQVAAGFYHTIVLVCEGKEMRKDSSRKLYEGYENEYPISDWKTLSDSFRKDIALICGVDDQDTGSLTGSTSGVRSSCRDLLTLLIQNLQCISESGSESNQIHSTINDKAVISEVVACCSVLTMMMVLSWENLKDLSRGSLPLSMDDANIFLKNTINLIYKAMRRYKLLLVAILKCKECQQANYYNSMLSSSDSVDLIREIESEAVNYSTSDLISLCFGKSFMSQDERGEDCLGQLRIQLCGEFYRMHKVIVSVYMSICTMPKFRDEREILLPAIIKCLAESSSICYGCPEVLRDFISSISDRVIQINSASDGFMDDAVSPHIRLLSSLGSELHRHEEVVVLFQRSNMAAMQIYSKFLSVYMHFSRLYIERRLQGHASSKSVNARKILTVLELTVTTMSKALLPLIFGTYEGKAQEVLERGTSLISQMIRHATSLLSQIIGANISEESLGILRYGTIVPSILPSVLLYCVSFVKRGVCMDILSAPLQELIHNLQIIGKCELCWARAKLNEKKTPNVSPSKDKDKETNASEVSTAIIESKDEEMNEAYAEEVLYLKKEQHQISWWFRLLKLATLFSSRMVTSDLRKLRDLFSFEEDVAGRGCSLQAPFLDVHLLKVFFSHPAWRAVSWEKSTLSSCLDARRIAEQLRSAGSSNCDQSIVLKDPYSIFRDEVKSSDAVYRMLVQSLQDSSRCCLYSIERNLMETICTVFGHECAKYHRIREKNFAIVVGCIKNIFNCRSVLVENSNGRNWSQILLVIEKVVAVFCDFMKNSFLFNRSTSRPLLLPFRPIPSTRAQRLWRKAVAVVVCLWRWSKAAQYSHLEEEVADFVLLGVRLVSDDLRLIPSLDDLGSRIHSIFDLLDSCDDITSNAAKGLMKATNLLEDLNSITIKSDILDSIATSIKEVMEPSDGTQLFLRNSWLRLAFNCSSCASRIIMSRSLFRVGESAVKMLQTYTCNPSHSCTLIELHALANSIRLVELLLHIWQNGSPAFAPSNAAKLCVFLYEKYVSWNSNGEERPIARKGSSIRDRNLAIKKCIFSLLSYSQAISLKASSLKGSGKLLRDTLDGYCNILAYLSRARCLEAQGALLFDDISSCSNKMDDSTSATPLAGFIVSSKTKEAPNKKKFQDLVIKPMEFSKSCEGLLVPGEKLLSNGKGTDFSVAVWIYIKSRPSPNKTALIVGKMNHSEAWPLLLVRSDGKLELAYGSNSELEKVVSEESIVPFVWSHLTLVVEQKKMKLFVNGVMDIQATTSKTNLKATSFPIVIGTCPSRVRAKLNNVKDGFDGLLSQCRYYSRALSPIHVKVIFDNGPPETVDISAKVVYHLLSSAKVVLLSDYFDGSTQLLSKVASICHSIFVTDSNARNRFSALDLLLTILSKDAIDDLYLTGWEHNKDNSRQFSSVSIFGCKFCDPALCFKGRLLLYFLRLIGCNWLPYFVEADSRGDNNGESDITKQLFFYSPLGLMYQPSISLSDDEVISSADHRPLSQNSLDFSLGFQISKRVQNLMQFGTWSEVFVDIAQIILQRFAQNDSNNNTRMDFVDLVGLTIVLGGAPSGAYLGADVRSVYDDREGRIINLNNSANSATILMNIGNDARILRVRFSDLKFDEEHSLTSLKQEMIVSQLSSFIFSTMTVLFPRLALLMKDFMTVVFPDCAFQQKSLLKCFRPVETFVFFKLLQVVCHHANRLQSLTCPDSLLLQLIQCASASIFLKSDDQCARGELGSCSMTMLAQSWYGCAQYVGLVPLHHSNLTFPSKTEEIGTNQFISNSLGIAEAHKFGKLLSRSGSCGSSLVALVTEDSLTSKEDELTPSNESHVMDSSFLDSCSEQETRSALWIFAHLRLHIVKLSRSTLNVCSPLKVLTEEVSFPCQVYFWVAICPHEACEREWFSIGDMEKVLSPHTLWNKMCQEWVSASICGRVTDCLTNIIDHLVSSFLHPALYQSPENILTNWDFFTNFVRNVLYWMEFHEESVELEKVAIALLKRFLLILPTPPRECTSLELILLQACVHAVRKLSVRVLDGRKLYPEAATFISSVEFAASRQRAQDFLLQHKGHHFSNISVTAYNATQLVTYMEIIQRRGSVVDFGEFFRVSTGSGKIQANLSIAKIQSIETSAPKIVSVKSSIIELDLMECASTVCGNPQNMQLIQNLIAGGNIDLDRIVVEVAVGVGSQGAECIFETVYCGSSSTLVHSGLMPDCAYQLKCRAYIGGIPLSWSNIVDFQTNQGLLFSFDSLRSGADIILSEDKLTASYIGDDNWSTLLGSSSFSSGVVSWEIRVNQSSTAYLFIGVATSSVDLSTFLGGCSHGWGFIGEQALYHNREKVKVYGEAFTSGDIIGVTLDFNLGTLSFSKNRKNLGVAFDKIYGDLYPAVAFYNAQQELQILPEGFKASNPHEAIPVSLARLNMDELSLTNELLLSLYLRRGLSHRLAVLVAEQCNQWCSPIYVRCKAVSQKDIFLSVDSPLLKRFGLVVGDRVRTYFGVAEVAGSAYNRVWFRTNSEGEVWFCTVQQIQEGRAKKQLFTRCTYENDQNTGTTCTANGNTWKLNKSSEGISSSGSAVASITYDASTILEMLEPSKWTEDMDKVLLDFYLRQAHTLGVEPWQLPSSQLFDNFRQLQQQLSRIVLSSAELSHKWGISGPKRKAVIARLGLLRVLNQLLDMYFPFFISDKNSKPFSRNSYIRMSIDDDFSPKMESLTYAWGKEPVDTKAAWLDYAVGGDKVVFDSLWSVTRFSWNMMSSRTAFIQELWLGPLHAIRKRIFPQLKLKHFYEVVRKTTTRPAKTDDDYDYPENLPHVKINRLKSLRAREAAELLHINGDDLMMTTLFFQLFKELRQHNDEKLRISYTHPMDDGQSRSFKIKFEGEGVDDYGGPYREIFGQICSELQLLYPGHRTAQHHNQKPTCFLPLLMPTPNWIADGDVEERYTFMFLPSAESGIKQDLILFLGQLIGIAIRSRITLDLSFPSFVWKTIVGEKLTEKDLASFDQSAWDFVKQLHSIHQRSLSSEYDLIGEDALEILRDLNWTVTLSDGRTVDLIENGSGRSVQLSDLSDYLTSYVRARFDENCKSLRMLRSGLVSIIPESAISLLTWEELQLLVCGSRVVDVDRLQNNTEYDDDLSAADPHIVMFWNVLREFDEAEKKAFLKFVWARPSLPPEGIEFTQKMRILNSVGDDSVSQDLMLPKAHTCFFSINLPKYSTKQIMAEKIRYAIFNCTEMDGDFRTTETNIVGWGASLESVSDNSLASARLL